MKKKFMSFLAFVIISVMSCSVAFADETTAAPENESTTVAEESTTKAQEEATTVLNMESQIATYSTTIIKTISTYSDTKLDYYINNTVGFENNMYTTYKSMVTEYGLVNDYEEAKVVATDDGYKSTMKVKCEKGDGKLTITFKYIDSSLTPIEATFSTVRADEGASVGKAALNTIMGMSTVVAVLVLILFIISLFVYTDKLVSVLDTVTSSIKNFFIKIFRAVFKKKEIKKEKVSEAIDQVVARIEENETNDLELVAVITAAIAAQTGASTDSFVVRKIKRR